MKRAADSAGARLRLEEVAREHALDSVAIGRLAALLELLSTHPRSPTTVTQPREAVDVHVADSLSALPVLDELGPERVADLGPGAGFPGIPVAVARPGIDMDLVETSGRTSAFLEHALDAVGMERERVRVVNSRAEEWAAGEGRDRYDAVVARAMAPLPVLLEYAAPLLRRGGTLIAWKGRPEDEAVAAAAAEVLGMEAGPVVQTQPYPSSRNRRLYLYRRVRPVPDSIPRRPGMARKRPLGVHRRKV